MARVVGALIVTLGVLLGAPASADAASTTSVVMYSDAGDYIGGGQHRLYTPGNSSITVSGGSEEVDVNVSGGPSGDYFTLTFAAPPGQALAPGVYVDAQRTPFRTAGHPGIDIYGSGRGCNEDAGRFEVKDIGMGADGKVNRLWLLYEHACEGGVAALFGEGRIGE